MTTDELMALDARRIVVTMLVDTNVLFDYLSEDGDWFDWSAAMLGEAFGRGPVAINPVIYAEVACRLRRD